MSLPAQSGAARHDVRARHNVKISGREAGQAMIFAHGFGCDQNMWRYVAPAFEDEHRVVLFDHVGAGGSDLSAYNRSRYGSLKGYADDVLEICRAGSQGGDALYCTVARAPSALLRRSLFAQHR